jgi:hypothetical protein
MGNYVLAPVYMSLGNYSRAFIGKQSTGYVLVAFLPVPKPEAFANGWTKNSPQYTVSRLLSDDPFGCASLV